MRAIISLFEEQQVASVLLYLGKRQQRKYRMLSWLLQDGFCEPCLCACTLITFLGLWTVLHSCSLWRYSTSFSLSSVIIWLLCMQHGFLVGKACGMCNQISVREG